MDASLRSLIEGALAEDLGSGDITSEAVIAPDAAAEAVVLAKQELVLAGRDVFGSVFLVLDPAVRCTFYAKDGDCVHAGTEIARITARTRVLLAGERVALNLLQHLSGIATLTARYVEKIKGFPVGILDTRKTLPGLRALEKYAVRTGGGRNHRFGLFDGALIKDNHIKACGGIQQAVGTARKHVHQLLKIEVETKTLDEVREALEARADVIMLDNMPLETMREAVRLVAGRAVVEASGNVTLDTVRLIAETGVDVISSGSLTHSAPAADISMKIQ
jgi:nicotinate-nucleotide pyrophosphorylase (carboxylating)